MNMKNKCREILVVHLDLINFYLNEMYRLACIEITLYQKDW